MYIKAAKLGHHGSYYKLGKQILATNYEKAITFFMLSAEKGYK